MDASGHRNYAFNTSICEATPIQINIYLCVWNDHMFPKISIRKVHIVVNPRLCVVEINPPINIIEV